MSNEKKPLIIISSRTGNTMMLGHALCDALPGSTLVRPADLPEDLSGYDPVLLGFWCDRGHAPEEMERAAERLRGKRIGCFATMGGNPQDEKARIWMQRTAEELVRKGEGNTLEGTFLCRGRIDPEVFERMTAMMGGRELLLTAGLCALAQLLILPPLLSRRGLPENWPLTVLLPLLLTQGITVYNGFMRIILTSARLRFVLRILLLLLWWCPVINLCLLWRACSAVERSGYSFCPAGRRAAGQRSRVPVPPRLRADWSAPPSAARTDRAPFSALLWSSRSVICHTLLSGVSRVLSFPAQRRLSPPITYLHSVCI